MKTLKWAAAAMLTVVIAACGGGGGGDSPPSNELRVGAITPASINATFPGGGNNRRVTLNASYSGQLTGSIGVVVVDPDAVFDAAFVRIGAGSTVDLDLYVSDTAPVGRHTRPLEIRVCSDLACTRQIAGFPRSVPKDVTITGTSVSATTLSFTSTAGRMGAPQHIDVTPAAGAAYTVDMLGYADYTDPNGNNTVVPLSSVFQVLTDATGFWVTPLAAYQGRYTAALRVESPGYGTVIVNLAYNVGAASGQVLTLLTPQLAATSQQGVSGDTQLFADVVRNLAPINDSLISIEHPPGTSVNDQQWLRFYDSTLFTPAGGVPFSGYRMRLIANACFITCLVPGTHTATVVYRADAHGLSTTVRVPVTFTITP